jgi:hypothetical protein
LSPKDPPKAANSTLSASFRPFDAPTEFAQHRGCTAEANAERDALEAERMGADTGLRRPLTRLTEEQLHEAEAMFARVAGATDGVAPMQSTVPSRFNPTYRWAAVAVQAHALSRSGTRAFD